MKNCVPEKSSKSFRISSVDAGDKRKFQTEIKALKHTMDKRLRKGGVGGKTYSKEGPNKKLVLRHKNGENFLGDGEDHHYLQWLYLQILAIAKL